MTSLITFRHVTRNVTGSVEGALVRLSQDGETATVLVRKTGKLARVPASSLSPAKGRPIKLVKGLCRADVDELIDGSEEFCRDAIEELFGRQLDSERAALATFADNDVGFRADDARRGSTLALKSVWSPVDLFYARTILRAYSGTQLFDVACEYLAEREIVEATDAGRCAESSETDALLSAILDGSLVN